MADKLGPIFVIRLGMCPVLVVSSWEAVKECFTTNDIIFASRPPSSFAQYLCYDYAAFGVAPYGKYWRDVRKMALLELLSARRLEKLRHIRIAEVETCIKEIFSNVNTGKMAPVSVNITKAYEELMLNIIVKKIAGSRYTGSEVAQKRDAEFRRLLKQFVYHFGQFVVSDIIPVRFLKWLDIQGHIKNMKLAAKELDHCMQIYLEEHKEKRMNGSGDADDGQDFIDVLLSIIKDETMEEFSRDTVIKATVLTLIVAGTDSTSNALSWSTSLLLNDRHVLKKAQEELDTVVGRERWVEESDIKNLVYLQAIVKETLRLYPPGPLSVPHLAREDCYVSDYFIPKGTQLFVNIWKLQRDPRVWSEPDKFVPERFLSGDHAGEKLEFSSQNFEYTPFGSGRRICPGISLASQVTHLMLARLLQAFDISTASNLPVDMSELVGFNLSRANPLKVLMKPRLPDLALYE